MTYKEKKQKIISFWRKRQKFFILIFLMGGFILDNLTLSRIDRLYDNLIISTHTIFVFASIIVYALIDAGKLKKHLEKWTTLSLSIMAFSFGGLFSAFSVFYLRSGVLGVSWPFILILFFLMLASEFFKGWFKKTNIQIALLGFSLQSYLIFFLPILTKKMNYFLVWLSGTISILIILFLVILIKKYIKNNSHFTKLFLPAFFVIILFQVSYFLNLIPPVPLSATFLSPAYFVEKELDGRYLITVNDFNNLDRVRNLFYGKKLFYKKGERIYFFASIFAPTGISTTIEHRWYLKEKGSFVEKNRIPVQINGGRKDGFRGFSFKQSLGQGKWRVDITTVDGHILGRRYFNLIELSPESTEFINKVTIETE